MDFSNVAAISAAGMEVARTRLDIAAVNLANVHTTRTADGQIFRPFQAVVVSGAAKPFSATFQGENLLSGPRVVGIRQLDVAPRLAYEPGHPSADIRGFVTYPGVDTTAEMVETMTAVRSYEANVAVMNAAKAMALKALEIGGGQ